ncbi:DUF1801 domain-containing protein [Maribacter sp. MMG018]|uniref:DUF1801 domain-containing protein n=1 Tax=Maribacter sp. MMG018 TaxID=2822688 RepID=UPI001B3939B8|nr:DUF1801 domain-containing protein [Maribacter sp. MMG018]MBQ4914216.1 DUF1801 domain-containing protein [Maribacter sp. MMG018]
MNPAESYIFDQPEPYREILLYLQSVIERNVPSANLKYKYRLPFYYVEGKPFCYMNASHKKRYVDLGFWNAAHLTAHLDKLEDKDRKVMKSLRYTSLQEIDEQVLIDVLCDAYAVRGKGFYK